MAIAFKENLAPFAVGRRANMEEWNTVTRVAEAAGIGFGVPVQPGVGERTCKALIATTGQNVLGITEASQVLPSAGDAYAQYDNVAVCESGVIGVLLGGAAAVGQQARFNTVNKTWTSVAQSATIVTIPGAQFDSIGKNGEVGTIRYRRPVPSLSISG